VDKISWVSGEQSIARYDVPGRTITSAFCKHCGSPVPYVSVSGDELLVPAGSLDGEPNIKPQDHIFWHEKAVWYEEGIQARKFSGFPE